MTLTKTEACALLHISDSTLQRRMKKGVYQFTRAAGQFGEVTFTHEGLGLPTPEAPAQPTPVEAPAPAQPLLETADTAPAVESFAPRPLTRAEMDEKFARDYLAGRETDGAGNTIHDKTCSLLGPVDTDMGCAPVESQSHMLPALLSSNDNFGNPVDSGHNSIDHAAEGSTTRGLSLAHGMTQQMYDDMCRANRQSHNVRSLADEEIATRRSVDNINRSFPTAPYARKSTVR
jgi:hypothetical protein